MKLTRKHLAQFPVVKALSSMKIMVSCLALLFILTFCGTVDQIDNGLYHAQEQFFHSFFFFAFGFLPFPGAQLVLWVLFVNLICVALVRFVYRWSNMGILIIHFGLLTYFVSAFVTLHIVEESHLTLLEGEYSNVSSSYRDWELSVWENKGNKKQVIAYDADHFKPGQALDFSEFGFNVFIKDYYPNSEAFTSPPVPHGERSLNSAGIQMLEAAEYNKKEPEKNTPGGIFLIKDLKRVEDKVLLYGVDSQPTEVKIGQGTYSFILRNKRFVLPLTVKLVDFMMEVHPNTEIARSYKSKVEIETDGLRREVTIFMNNPLRYKNMTFYQASYSIDGQGREHSTLAVVKNSGRLLPYIASLLTFTGLVTHFLMMAFSSKFKTRKA